MRKCHGFIDTWYRLLVYMFILTLVQSYRYLLSPDVWFWSPQVPWELPE